MPGWLLSLIISAALKFGLPWALDEFAKLIQRWLHPTQYAAFVDEVKKAIAHHEAGKQLAKGRAARLKRPCDSSVTGCAPDVKKD